MNVDVGHLHAIEQLELYPWTADALRLLRRAGYHLIVVTNQGGIAQGYSAEGFVERAHEELQQRLEKADVRIDGFYYCPHHPNGTIEHLRCECRCRKPSPGMIEAAARDFEIDLAKSWMIGDKWLDVGLGHAVGARSILVRTGWGKEREGKRPAGQKVDAICDNLAHAVAVILSDGEGAKSAKGAKGAKGAGAKGAGAKGAGAKGAGAKGAGAKGADDGNSGDNS